MKALTLIGGYTDAQGTTHRDVEIGNVIHGADLFEIEQHPFNSGLTSLEVLILGKAITKFGTLKMPVPTTALIALDSIDRDDLYSAYDELESEAYGGVSPKPLADHKLILSVGCELEGVNYNSVEFGTRITVRDYIEADNLGLTGTRRGAYLAGRQVRQLSQTEGGATLPGPLELAVFEKLLLVDIYGIREAAETFRQSFREGSKKI
jgi:hypothetical protein